MAAYETYSEVEEKVKVEDWKVIFRLGKYAKPYWPILVLGIFLILVSAGIDLAIPYIQKITIDSYINAEHHYTVEMDNGNPVFIKNEEGRFTLQQLEDGNYVISDGETQYNVTDEQLQELRQGDLAGVTRMSLILLSLLVVMFFVMYMQVYSMSYLAQKVTHRIRMALFKHIIRLPMRFFDTNPSGRLATRVANDTRNLAEFFSSVIASIVKDVVLLVGIVIVMLSLSTYLGTISLMIFPIILASTLVFRYFDRIAYRKVRNRLAVINAYLAEHISGMSVIQLFNQQKNKANEFDEVNNRHLDSLKEQLIVFAIFRPLMDFLYYLGVTILLWYGSKAIFNETLQFGVLYAFVSYIEMFFRPLRDIAEKYDIVQNALASAEKIFKLMDEKEEQYNEQLPETKKVKGNIDFDHVFFAYDRDNPVLRDVSFKVSPKEKIAFVGETGAGKTTIISLLNALYRIQKGDIKIDEKSIYEYNLKALRRRIGVVLQDVFLFSGSIIDNIRLYNKEISREEVIRAANYVYADTFIKRFPNGYDTEILERGGTISAGERQLIALARAVLYDADILILDEATANIDTETETLIQKAMERVSKDKTVLTIAHRISTISGANRILVIHKGKLVEEGNHEELMKKGGIYADLYKLQYELGDIA